MAKKGSAVYAPGELSRVRDKLGDIDQDEAKRIANALGGEIGYERSEEPENTGANAKNTRYEHADVKVGNRGKVPKRRVELAGDGAEAQGKPKPRQPKMHNPADDPSVPLKPGYWDRVRMDRFAGQSQFDIKSPGQILVSIFSIFGDIPDYVNPHFINKRMREYYEQLETLVVSTRTMFPRNHIKRNERLKKTAPMVYSILDIIRYWDIEKISGELARLQAHPRNIRVVDCAEIIRTFYRPLFLLERLDMDAHIRAAYKILYKILYIENPLEAQDRFQGMVRSALSAYGDIRRDIRYLMYPLLMKAVSAKWLPYERFFAERNNRIMAFLKVKESEQIDPALADVQVKKIAESEISEEEEEKEEESQEETREEQVRQAAIEAEKKAFDRGVSTLEALFPKAGWEQLDKYPDLYPYFADVFDLRKGFVNIAPTDPLQQIMILMRILEELFFSLRDVSFGTIMTQDGRSDPIGPSISNIMNNWHYYIESSFEREYLPRLSEYVRLLEGSPEDWNSPYARKTLTDLHWTKRLYFLPYYKFESIAPPSFAKKDITPIYPEIKKLRRYLAGVGIGIEKGRKAGGAATRTLCDGINNPWDPYVFQVTNPLSVRLDALLDQKNKINASLVYFTLATVTVLDYLVNNENSWAYGERPGPLFRSVDGKGVTPLTGIDTRINADALFKASLKKRDES